MHQSTHALRARLANRYALRQRFMHGVGHLMVSLRYTTVLLALSTTCGCVPLLAYKSPRIEGQVVSAAADAPIVGARALLKEHPEHFVQTDQRGFFVLESKSEYKWCALVPDACLPYLVTERGTLIVQSPGFRSAEVAFPQTDSRTPQGVDLIIRLEAN